MRTRHNRYKRNKHRRNSTKRYRGGKPGSGKKWVTAIDAAQSTLKKTGSINKAKSSLRKQALSNARKLFGSISSI
jgi:hypothetical protein